MILLDLPYSFVRRLRLALAGLALIAGLNAASAQTTVIQYNGALHLNGSPFTGTAEFAFTLWDALAAGNQVAASTPASVIVGVTNGVFTTALDFGAGVFTGANRWLQIQVRTNIAPFSLLSPRQPITAVPYAIRAAVASTTELPGGNYSNAVVFSNPGNLFAGNGFALTALNAGNLASGTVADARIGANVARTNQVWLLGGNAGINTNTHFIGTTDQKPIEFRVNNQRVLRLEAGGDSIDPDAQPDGAPNVIAGSRVNFVSNGIVGATVSGGGATNYNGAGYTNRVFGHFGTIGGGLGNEAAGHFSVVSGGGNNRASANLSSIGGGEENVTSGAYATLGGGYGNEASGYRSAVSGGFDNQADGNSSVIGGGGDNIAGGDYSTVGGGTENAANGDHSTVAGGQQNTADGLRSTVGGGVDNRATNNWSTVAGGGGNISGFGAAIGGGVDNIASGIYSTVAGGLLNVASGDYAVASGYHAHALHRGSFVWADGSSQTDFASTGVNQFCLRAVGGVHLSDSTKLHFGSLARQMINLYNEDYGIGVQSSTMYFRSNDRFSWYRSGAHNVNENAPGTGGSVLMTLTSGGLTVNGAFVNASDRDKKTNFQSVDPAEVLAKVIALPLSRWTYRDDEERGRHLGPMAQDFHAAFGLGADNKHIATVDADGVALAAIQGLNAKVDQVAADAASRVGALEAANAALERRLAELERLVSKLAAP